MDKRDLLPASIRSGADFNVYSQFSQIEDRVASLKDFCTASTKRSLMQCFGHIKSTRKTYHHTANM